MNCFDVCFSVCETPFGWNIGLLFWELLFIGALIGLIAYKLAIWVYEGYLIGKAKKEAYNTAEKILKKNTGKKKTGKEK